MGCRTWALLAGLALAGWADAAPPGMRMAAKHGVTGRYFAKGQLYPTARLRSGAGGGRGRAAGGTAASPYSTAVRPLTPITANPYGFSGSNYAPALSGSRFYTGQ